MSGIESLGNRTSEHGVALAQRHSSDPAFPGCASNKIHPRHYDRLAVVYVRQSSPHQVQEHRESTARQYGLADRAVALGWSRERVLVIDEDQGQSGRTAVGREGFQRLLAEVGLDHVGLVLGIEMSRLARSCKDWHQLIELCARFGTLLGDQDGLYDPTNHNDRLLLGLKGTMSEAGLHVLHGRLHQGQLNKARRGKLFSHPPIGYVRSPTGEFELDPDEQVQTVVQMVFDKFEELGSAGAVLRYMTSEGILMAVRVHGGPNHGNVQWRRPSRSMLSRLLRHPIYAGAYCWGRRKRDPRRKLSDGQRSSYYMLPMEEWTVLLKDSLPAYISWQQFDANLARLKENQTRPEAKGSPREGPGLLPGLIRCGKCGARMIVAYVGHKMTPRYSCQREQREFSTAPCCQSIAGEPLEEFIGEKILAAMEPAALELSLRAADDIQQERDRLHQHWKQRLERADYEVQRAARQYHAVEPENRLVARELEGRWEKSLADQRTMKEEYERFCQRQPSTLTPQEQELLLRLAKDIPALWHAPETRAADRKTIVRHLIESVEVTVQGQTERVEVAIQWAGGFISRHDMLRPVRHFEQMACYEQFMCRITELYDAGRSAKEIAKQLAAEGWRSPRKLLPPTATMVKHLLRTKKPDRCRRRAPYSKDELLANEWWLGDLARLLDMPHPTLYAWLRRHWIQARQLPSCGNQWAVWANEDEVERLRRLRRFTLKRDGHVPPPSLTTPENSP